MECKGTIIGLSSGGGFRSLKKIFGFHSKMADQARIALEGLWGYWLTYRKISENILRSPQLCMYVACYAPAAQLLARRVMTSDSAELKTLVTNKLKPQLWYSLKDQDYLPRRVLHRALGVDANELDTVVSSYPPLCLWRCLARAASMIHWTTSARQAAKKWWIYGT